MTKFSFILQTATYEISLQSSIPNNSLEILSKFPNINLNPVVVLEDISKKADTTRYAELNEGRSREPFVEQQDQHTSHEENNTEIIEYILPNDDEPMAPDNISDIQNLAIKSKPDDRNTAERNDEHINADI